MTPEWLAANFYQMCASMLVLGTLMGFMIGAVYESSRRHRKPVAKGPFIAMKSSDEFPFNRDTPVERVYRHFNMLQRQKSFGKHRAREN